MTRPRLTALLSRRIWRPAPNWKDRVRAGSFNHVIVRAFARGARAVDVCDRLPHTHPGRFTTTARPRDYVCQRVGELRRRGVLVVDP